jgi:hypothetical protein
MIQEVLMVRDEEWLGGCLPVHVISSSLRLRPFSTFGRTI